MKIQFQRHSRLRKLRADPPHSGIAARLLPPIATAPAEVFRDWAPGALPWAWGVLVRLPRRWRRSRDRRAAIAELRRLNAALLSDIGLERGDIERVVDAMMAARDSDEGVAVAAHRTRVAVDFVCHA